MEKTEEKEFVIKRDSRHFRLVNCFFHFNNQVSICRYFWAIPLSLLLLIIVSAVKLSAALVSTVLFIGYPCKPSKLFQPNKPDFIKCWPVLWGWFHPCIITTTGILIYGNVSFWTTWRLVDNNSGGLPNVMAAITFFIFFATTFVAIILAMVLIGSFFEDTDTGKIITEYIRAKKSGICPLLTIEPEPQTKGSPATAS